MENNLAQLFNQQQIWTQQLLEKQQAMFSKFMENMITDPKKNIPPFPKLKFGEENVNAYSRQLKEHFKAYDVEDDEKKKSYFLSWMGTELFELVGKLIGQMNYP